MGDAQKVSGLGQKRLALTFHRLLMPDDYSVDLDQFHGLDQAGEPPASRTRSTTTTSRYSARRLRWASSPAPPRPPTSIKATTSPAREAYKAGIASSLSQSSANVLDRFINIPPTITIREGHRIKVYITQDMLLPAYENHDMPGVM